MKVFPYLLVAVEVHRANLTIKSLQIYLPTNLWIKWKLLGVHNVIGHGTHTPFLCFLKRMIHWQTGRHATLNSSYSESTMWTSSPLLPCTLTHSDSLQTWISLSVVMQVWWILSFIPVDPLLLILHRMWAASLNNRSFHSVSSKIFTPHSILVNFIACSATAELLSIRFIIACPTSFYVERLCTCNQITFGGTKIVSCTHYYWWHDR